MAAKKQSKETTVEHKPIDFREIQWVYNNLSKSELEEYDGNPMSLPEATNGIHLLLELGFKVSFRFDTESGSPMGTAVCNMTGYLNSGLATSARGEDFSDVLALLVYKILVVAQGDLRQFAEFNKKTMRG